MDWVLGFLPFGLSILSGRLLSRDKNSIGADDAAGRLINNMLPIIPGLISGGVNDNTADKVFLAIHATSEAYLKERGKLPGAVLE